MRREVEITPDEWFAGEAEVTAWENGKDTGTYADLFMVGLNIMQRAERVVLMAELLGGIEALPPADLFATENIGGHLDRAEKVGGPDGPIAIAYRAALGAVRGIVTSFKNVTPAGFGSDQLGAFPLVPVVWGVVGITAVAGATFWGVDKNEKVAEVKKAAIAAQVSQYLKQVEASLATGQPIPEPNNVVADVAAAEGRWPWWQFGAAVLLGGAAAYGVMSATEPTYANPSRVGSPVTTNTRRVSSRTSTPRSRVATRPRKNPSRKKKTATKKKTTRKTAPKKKTAAKKKTTRKNPCGTKRTTKAQFIRRVMAKGKTRKQAEALWRGPNRNPSRKKKATKRPSKKTARKKNPSRKRKAPSKRKTAKKKTSRKAPARKKNPQTKAAFMREQQRKGASKKQATARWNFKRQAKKRRSNPKRKRAPAKKGRGGARRRLPNPGDPQRWRLYREAVADSRHREAMARAERDAELAAVRSSTKRARKAITKTAADRRARAREEARRVLEQEKEIRREERDLFRDGKEMTATESDSLALHSIPRELHDVWEPIRHRFDYGLPPDHRAELFMEWAEEHPVEIVGELADKADAIDWSARERAYYGDDDEEVPF